MKHSISPRVLFAVGASLWLLAGSSCKKKTPPTPPVQATVNATAPAKADKVPTLEVPKLPPNALTIDGMLDEPAWQTAADTGPFVHPGDGRPQPQSPVRASAKLAWDDEALYFGFVVHDAKPTSPFKPGDLDPHVWEKSSAVELMIQPGDPKNNKHYYEIQVDVAGAVWDTRFDDYNKPITGGPDAASRRFGHQQWRSALSQGIVVDDEAGTYTVELAIPWSSLPSPQTAVPPRPGDAWRINLYSFRDGQRQSLAWSPIRGQGNFHKSSRFGRVTFGGAPSGAPSPATP